MRTRRTRPNGDRGAAAVEMALVLPLLLIVLFGVIDFGRAFNEEETLTQAARVGARLAVVGNTSGAVKAAVQAAASSTVSISLNHIKITGNCSAGDASATVTVWDADFNYINIGGIKVLPVTRKIVGKATAPC